MNVYDFLSSNSVSEQTKTFKLSDRIPFNFTIKAIHCDELARLRNSAIRIIEGVAQVDVDKMQSLICVACTTFPNFNNEEFIKKMKAKTGREALNKSLLPGEKDRLYNEIQKLCGYKQMNVEIEEAKKQ